MALSFIKSIIERLVASGEIVECSCCGHKASRFFPAGVVNKRPYARCAFCGSLERHRLVALMLKKLPLIENSKTLCIAPEQPLTQFLKKTFISQITTLDLNRNDVDVQGDICALPFQNESFDVVIANHVLEHVKDDQLAMQEIKRVLKPQGRTILQSPIHWEMEKTEEDPSATPAECLRRFGQSDHVRLYGRDFIQRLQNIDWDAKLIPVSKYFTPAEIKKYGLEVDEVFFQVNKNG
jgi:SAM-dependent methyltransferase